jgi:hypothetical protein
VNGLYIALTAGDYDNTTTLNVGGKRWLVGRGATATVVRNSGTGSTFVIDAGGDVTFDSLRISDAKGVGTNHTDGIGISCPDAPAGTRSVHVFDDVFTNNGDGANGAAISGGPCTFELRRSTFDGNYLGALLSTDSTIDSCNFVSNVTYGLLVNGNFSITNSFMARNQIGAAIGGATTTPTFAFNTIADNAAGGVLCTVFTGPYAPISADNNLVIRNQPNTGGNSGDNNCSFPGSLISGDATGVRFAHPDSAPYDYHLTQGSSAIDQAVNSSIDHDYDGDTRPKGNGRDLGADEAF